MVTQAEMSPKQITHKDHHDHLDIQLYQILEPLIPVESVLLKVDPGSTRYIHSIKKGKQKC